MAIKELKREWSPCQLGYVKHFLLHWERDVKDLPECCVGSIATVSETDNEYIYTADGWKLSTECGESESLTARVTALTEEFDAFKESGGGGMPEGGAPNQMLVTNADGETEWQERPVYKTTEAISVNDFIGVPLYPTTFTTVANSGMNMAQGEFIYMNDPGVVCKVVFDGATYSCVVAEDGSLGAKADSSNGTIDFSEYPFVFVNPSMIFTETSGEHTIEAVYVHTVETKVNYGTNIFVETKKDENRMPYLSLEQVEQIESAWGNGATISISTNVPGGGLGVSATVTEVTDSFIYATATYSGSKGCVETVTYIFAVSDGTLYKSGRSVIGSVTENAAMYPVMYIKGRYYKINVDDSGTLTATEVTE